MNKKYLPLIIAASLPVIFIVLISIVIFTPSLSIKPQHNFIYTTGDSYYTYDQEYRNTYVVENNQIAIKANPVQPDRTYEYKGDTPTLYLYNVKTNSSYQITFDEAKNYTLDKGPSSPDGYSVNYRYNSEGIFELFGSNDSNDGFFIEKENGRKKLTGFVNNDRYYYQDNFKLIGWIK